MSESRVVEMWRDCLREERELVTEDGEKVRVVYPGRRNSDRGADFLDAVIATNRGLVTGDIEVHVKSSGWRTHKHYLDPAYNRVIMHVVYRNDTTGDIRLYNGQSVATLALDSLSAIRSGRGRHEGFLPCRNALRCLTDNSIGDFLEAAGEERFQASVKGFSETPAEPGQTLYQGIMAALGYAKNKHQFLDLARHVPLRLLESITSGEMSDSQCLVHLQSLLLGTAGLLPWQNLGLKNGCECSDTWLMKLVETWAGTGRTAALSADDWHLFRLRPGNFPVRRIAAMSYLLVRYRSKGLLAGLMEGLYQPETGTGHSGLENSLLVSAGGYWARNLDFHLSAWEKAPALLGRSRAADIIINVLLPFAAATVSKTQAIAVYRRYPRSAVNTLERHMIRQLGLDRRMVNSARRQQGLLHIYKALCSQAKCHQCPLNRQAA